jgi:imidazoleglycerol-phosphate dehydratase
MQAFWNALASSAKLEIELVKIRGDNGHHIVESSFKAFSRALRQWLDAPTVFSPNSDNDAASIALGRSGSIERSTKETKIAVQLLLNGCTDPKEIHVHTGIPMLDQFVTVLCQAAQISCRIDCQGDLWVDDHHTTEDVSIAIGQCLTEALGTKAGLNRMGVAQAQVGTALVEVTMDLSNRPYLGHDLHETLGRNEEVVDRMSCEMMEHMLDSLVMNGRMTVHIVERTPDGTHATVKDTMLATAQAFGEALRVCAMVDQRRAGQTASSKGTLSV